MKLSLVAAAAQLSGTAIAATPDDWRSQSIYFLLTDRFGRTDNSTTAACDPSDQVCCLLVTAFKNKMTQTNDDYRYTVADRGKELSITYVLLAYPTRTSLQF